jgi:succinylglutamate desuccinylase
MAKRLTIIDELPEHFLTIEYQNIKELFDRPTLIHLKGKKEPSLFVSILLHGNEYSGLMIMQELLAKHKADNGYDLPRSIWLFIGNVEAASQGLRRLDSELDFNRAWPGTTKPEDDTAQLISEVMRHVTNDKLFAAVDLHNNTGKNPPYGCISVVDEPNQYLATLFNHIAMVFHTPKGVSTIAFDGICPAITLECSTPGNRLGIDKAIVLLEDLMHLDHFPTKPMPSRELQLVSNHAVLKVVEGVSFGFEDEKEEYELTFIANFDRHNFTQLQKGEVFAFTTLAKPLVAIDENGVDVTDDIIKIESGKVSLKESYTPSMITLDKRVIAQDCLCYLLQEY